MSNKFEDYLDHSYQTTLQKAAWLIYNFLKQPALCEIAKNEAIGGIIEKSTLKGEKFIYEGTSSWFCRNTDPSNGFPKCFLAFEDGKYDIGKVPKEPTTDTLRYSNETFTYEKIDVSEQAVLEMLTAVSRKPSLPESKIDKADVNKLLWKFGDDPIKRHHNRYYCSFFENKGKLNGDMKNLMDNNEVEFIKYYFGYDASHEKYFKSNRIRVILMGYNSSRALVSIQQLMDKTGLILQDSWPPPPPRPR